MLRVLEAEATEDPEWNKGDGHASAEQNSRLPALEWVEGPRDRTDPALPVPETTVRGMVTFQERLPPPSSGLHSDSWYVSVLVGPSTSVKILCHKY